MFFRFDAINDFGVTQKPLSAHWSDEIETEKKVVRGKQVEWNGKKSACQRTDEEEKNRNEGKEREKIKPEKWCQSYVFTVVYALSIFLMRN